MSRLDDLKEQLKAIGQRIQETSTYVQLQERYQSLPPASQKLVNVVAAFAFVFLLIFYPLSSFFNSQTTLTSFNEKRELIRELFKTYRESSARPMVAYPPPVESLKATINSILTTADLTPEQNNGVVDSPTQMAGTMIPQALIGHAVEVRLSKLNLKQIVDIGANLVGISDSVKMKDISIIANMSDTRYFDVVYKLYSLNVPEPVAEAPPEPEKPKRGGTPAKKTETKSDGDE